MSDERTPATLVCAARVEPEQLSAWRDGVLSEDQAAWLRSHVAGCPACGERLRDYERIGSALREQVIPRPKGDLWPETQRLIANGGRRWRLVGAPSWGRRGAIAAAALLVALFAGLLIHQLPHRHGAPATATPTAKTLAPTEVPTATATPVGSAWTQVTSFAQAPNPPAALATQYDVFSGQDSKGSTPYFRFRRSDDFGQTWVNLSPPQIAGVKYPDNVSAVTGIMSPLDPKTYILMLQLENISTCPQPSAQNGRMCQVQYVTQDGGATWTLLSLPAKGLVAVAWPFGQGVFPLDLSVQGTRLYSTVNDVMFAASGATPPGRLVASDDGGATWSLVDDALNAQQLMVYGMTATPTGSTVFALAGVPDPNLMPGQLPPLSLWRSEDGGGNWREVTMPAQNFGGKFLASSDASTGKSILYMVAGDTYSNTHLYASADGAVTWRDSGVSLQRANGASPDFTLLATLSDGSLLFTAGSDVERWDGGSDAPHIVAPQTGLGGVTGCWVKSNPDGTLTIWLSGWMPTGNVIEYATVKG